MTTFFLLYWYFENSTLYVSIYQYFRMTTPVPLEEEEGGQIEELLQVLFLLFWLLQLFLLFFLLIQVFFCWSRWCLEDFLSHLYWDPMVVWKHLIIFTNYWNWVFYSWRRPGFPHFQTCENFETWSSFPWPSVDCLHTQVRNAIIALACLQRQSFCP